ncbi:MAG: phenylalanine--tRNA ligase subunit beta [Thalassobaculales bacterium]
MKLTLSWLKDHLDTDAPLERIVASLTMLGLEVDGVEDRGAGLEPFVIGHVLEARQHPNADRLRVAMVDIGAGQPVQVVCGAPNCRSGMKGVFAPPGTRIPGTGVDLKPGVIRGVESNGMLCSEREMGLSDEHDGIIDLPSDAPIGRRWAEWAGLGDPVLDVKITPNRADCLSVRGIARDLAAAGLGTLKPLPEAPAATGHASPVRFVVAAEARDLAPLIVGRHFRGLRNGPSPAWMQDRLKAVGLRPISALVDVTNYVMLDLGRPLHAYDAGKIDGDLTVRLARAGERYLALNGKEYVFEDGMLVIGDRHGIDDLAGVMGGARSGCSEATTEMYLEAAIFDPVSVATTGRKLNLQSDARYRFERGLDPTGPFWGIEAATRLILALCGGEASALTVAGAPIAWERRLTLRIARIAELGGVAVPEGEARAILERLGCTVEGSGTLSVIPPPWRRDIEGEADLVEEVLRVHGYDSIPSVSLPQDGPLPGAALAPLLRRTPLAKRALAARGLMEALTFSFMPKEKAKLFGGGGDNLTLVNPISSDLDQMRPSILPNLLDAARRNADRGLADLGLFEVAPAYADDTPKGQSTIATVLRTGQAGPRHWLTRPRPVDAFDAKADALAVLEALGAPVDGLQVSADAPGWYHPGRSGQLRLGSAVLARFGELHPGIVETYGLKGPAVGAEVVLEAIPPAKARGSARPLLKPSPFLPLVRDFAFVVDRAVTAEQVLRAARGADRASVTKVELFDVYEGAGLPPGTRSIAIAATIQPAERTLTEAEIEAVAARIVAAVAKATGASLRT